MPGFPTTRVGDINNAKGVLFKGVPTVLVNARPIGVMALGMVTVHPGFTKKKPHPINPILKGSKTVLAMGMGVGHVGSPDMCKHIMMTGAKDVLVGV